MKTPSMPVCKQQDRDVVLAPAVGDRIPRPDDRDHADEGRQHDQQQRDAVDAHAIGNAELRAAI